MPLQELQVQWLSHDLLWRQTPPPMVTAPKNPPIALKNWIDASISLSIAHPLRCHKWSVLLFAMILNLEFRVGIFLGSANAIQVFSSNLWSFLSFCCCYKFFNSKVPEPKTDQGGLPLILLNSEPKMLNKF